MLPEHDRIGYMVQARPNFRLHIVTTGPQEGEPIIFLHGFPEFWFSWRYQLQFLGERNFRAIAVDLRGVNYSDKPSEGYDPPNLVQDIIGLMNHLHYPKATIIGHDYGGFIAYLLALLFPHRVKRLVILNTLHPAKWPNPRISPFGMRLFASLAKLGYDAAKPVLNATNQSLGLGGIMKYLAYNKSALPSHIRRAYSRAYQRSGSTAIAYAPATVKWLTEHRIIDLRIQHPTLVLWSTHDFTAPFWVTRSLPESIPHAEVVPIPQAGHWLQQEQPAAVNAALWKFLNVAE